MYRFQIIFEPERNIEDLPPVVLPQFGALARFLVFSLGMLKFHEGDARLEGVPDLTAFPIDPSNSRVLEDVILGPFGGIDIFPPLLG